MTPPTGSWSFILKKRGKRVELTVRPHPHWLMPWDWQLVSHWACGFIPQIILFQRHMKHDQDLQRRLFLHSMTPKNCWAHKLSRKVSTEVKSQLPQDLKSGYLQTKCRFLGTLTQASFLQTRSFMFDAVYDQDTCKSNFKLFIISYYYWSLLGCTTVCTSPQ